MIDFFKLRSAALAITMFAYLMWNAYYAVGILQSDSWLVWKVIGITVSAGLILLSALAFLVGVVNCLSKKIVITNDH